MSAYTVTPTKQTTASRPAKPQSAGGCGCGCGCGGNCGCKGDGQCRPAVEAAICEPCHTQALARPRFFAGQLLTEEDLQALSEYVVAKNRLTNRNLFGTGVVCGLRVKEQPCKKGWVIVVPGHALDCCGNDIVVNCPEELDILKMLRELRTRLRGGYDCGDPCVEESTLAAVPANEVGQADAVQPDSEVKDKTQTPEPPVKPKLRKVHVDLFIRYCEQKTDPVMPYAADEPCTNLACQPTRIREGYCFELRCHEEPVAPPLISAECKRRIECLCDQMACYGGKVLAFGDKMPKIKEAAELLRDATVDVSQVENTLADLLKFRKTAGEKESTDLPTRDYLNGLHEAVRRAIHMTMAVKLTGNKKPLQDKKNWQTEIEAVLGTDGKPGIAEQLLLGYAKAFEQEKIDLHHTNAWISIAKDNKRGAEDFFVQAIAADVDLIPEDLPPVIHSFQEWHRSLVDLTAEATSRSSRKIQTKLSRIKTDRFRGDVKLFKYADAEILADYSQQMVCIAEELFQECICPTWLVPCPPCEDPSVRLACLVIDLDMCDIDEICNFCRQYVESPVARRYWGIDFSRCWTHLRELCCGDDCPPCPPPHEEKECGPDLIGIIRDRMLKQCIPPISYGYLQTGATKLSKLRRRNPQLIDILKDICTDQAEKDFAPAGPELEIKRVHPSVGHGPPAEKAAAGRKPRRGK